MQIASSIIPRERTPFIGRERERALLLEDIERGTGLLTITGPSGIGKTRLARQLLGEVDEIFGEEQQFFCNLEDCEKPAEVEAAVARALGVPDKHGRALVRTIAARGRLLLILDNLDRVAPRLRKLIGDWLDGCFELQMVATSIVPIGIEGEVRFELGPMEPEDAVALYMDRAHRAWAGRAFAKNEAELVEELVVRLDRIPLAIELAAARVRVLPPRTLLSRFDERFELLRTGVPGRRGSLHDALTLTWELLDPRERAVLIRSSIFEGGFTYEAAVAVLNEGADVEMLDFLDGLRSKALLQIEESEPPRFLLFESVRDYAKRELQRQGLLQEAQDRHSQFFVEQGEKRVGALLGAEALEAIAWLKAERANLLAVLNRNAKLQPELAARAGLVLYQLLALEGFPPHTAEILDRTLRAARACEDPRLLAHAYHAQAISIVPQGKVDQARKGLNQALLLAREAGDRELEGTILQRLAYVHLRKGELNEAEELGEAALAIAKEGYPDLEARCLMVLGATVHARSDPQKAEEFYTEALSIQRRHGLVRREEIALTWLGAVWTSQGRFREARRALHDVLTRSRESGTLGLEANVLLNLGAVDLAAGLLDESERYSLQALEIQRKIGNRRGEGTVLCNLGIAALERGDLERAERLLMDSVGTLRDVGDRRVHAAVLPFLAVLEARVGRLLEARRSLEEARDYFQEMNDEASLRTAEVIEGILEVAEARTLAPGRIGEATALVEQARARLASATAPSRARTGSIFEAIRLLQQDLEDWAAGSRGLSAGAQTEGLRVGPEGGWFELAGKERVDLRRRVAIRRILDALVQKRLTAPGVGMGPQELFEVGWPQVKIHPDAAMRRVYLGIWTLRDVGLADVLLNQTDGYLLDPKVPVLRQRE